ESTMDSANNDDFDPSDNDQEKDSNDDEILASTSTSSSNLNRVKKRKRKGKKPGSFVWQFFKKYDALILKLDNLEEEVEKVQCLFDGCDTEYVWLGSTSNLISHFRDIHQITKELLANKSVKVH
ncbi:14024_t:CDS:1, partial [Cetraspora pellucida]